MGQMGKAVSVAALYLLFTAATVGSFGWLKWRLDVATEHGEGVDRMIVFLLFATGAMFVVGHLLLGWFVLRSTRIDGPRWKPVSARAEWLTAIIPILFVAAAAEGGVLAIGLPVVSQIYDRNPQAIEIEVVGRQFTWMYRYPGKDGKFGRCLPRLVKESNPLGLDEDDEAALDDIFMDRLVVPQGRPVALRIRSQDVLHSFTIPLFRTKQDAVPGIVTRSHLTATKLGDFEVTCAELCGNQHYDMKSRARVLPPAEFDRWLAEEEPFYGE